MLEIWKDIKGYEGLYQISNYGKVKSLKRGILLKPCTNHKGYLSVVLYKKSEKCCKRIHRLVAEAFIPNSNNKPQVNHIDCNKHNNKVDNLEWCDNSENQIHAFKNRLQTNTGNNNPRARRINQYDLNGDFIKTWESIYDIINTLQFNRSTIWRCCTGRYKQGKGYIWRYVD